MLIFAASVTQVHAYTFTQSITYSSGKISCASGGVRSITHAVNAKNSGSVNAAFGGMRQ